MSLVHDIAMIDTERCGTCRWYRGLPEEDRTAFNEYVASGGQLSALHRVCVGNGLVVQSRQFYAHMTNHHVQVEVDHVVS